MKNIPLEFAVYKKMPIFTEQSVPSGLLNQHRLNKGFGGVLKGKLLYTIFSPEEKHVLDIARFGVVEPTVIHKVEPLGGR